MRRIILSHLFSLLILQLLAQTKTVALHGTVTDTMVKSVELSYLVDANLSKWDRQKLPVVNGGFHTTIQIPFPVEMNIAYGNRVYGKNFIYNDAQIRIDNAAEPRIIGSAVHEEYEKEFLPFFQKSDEAFDSVQSFLRANRQKYGADLPAPVKDSANVLKEKFCYQRAALLRDYIKRHPDSYVALWNIYYFMALGNLDRYFDFENLLSSFSNRVQEHSFINALKEKLVESRRLQVGQPFPEEFFKGKEKMQSDIRSHNQYYLIDFWYSHCNPCIGRFPRLKRIYDQFHTKGFDIVSISVDKEKDKVDYVAAIKKNGLAWNHVWDKNGAGAQKFNINRFPTYILLDKNDRIISFDIEEDQLEAFLKEHLGSL